MIQHLLLPYGINNYQRKQTFYCILIKIAVIVLFFMPMIFLKKTPCSSYLLNQSSFQLTLIAITSSVKSGEHATQKELLYLISSLTGITPLRFQLDKFLYKMPSVSVSSCSGMMKSSSLQMTVSTDFLFLPSKRIGCEPKKSRFVASFSRPVFLRDAT